MIDRNGSQVSCEIRRAIALLDALLDRSELDVRSVATEFEQLAHQIDGVLSLVGAIVDCIDNECVQSILPQVQALGNAARHFTRERLQATSGIAEIVAEESKLLEKLCNLTGGQRSIAKQTQVLSVMTNIEVANLGPVGAGFQYLAHELDGFSQGAVRGSEEIADHTERRRREIEETRRRLSEALPRMNSDFSRIDEDLGKALTDLNEAITALSANPLHFRDCVRAIAAHVSSVVAAVQSQDITRQQIEHVRDALKSILCELENGAAAPPDEPSRRAAVIKVQDRQLKILQDSSRTWVSQIGDCLDEIQRISSSEIAAIGSIILEHERLLSAQMARIEQLERESQADDSAMHNSLGSLGSLMELVREHLGQSQLARGRMQLLNLNSMIEARHLGSRAAVMVEISQNIRRISTDWSGITTRSGEAMEEIADMVRRADDGLNAFSLDSKQTLHDAQEATRSGLACLQSAASTATNAGAALGAAVAKLHGQITSIRSTANTLSAGFALLDEAFEAVNSIDLQMNGQYPDSSWRCDRGELEERLSAAYTTEIERQVLRSALYGEAMPSAGTSLAGNDVELF